MLKVLSLRVARTVFPIFFLVLLPVTGICDQFEKAISEIKNEGKTINGIFIKNLSKRPEVLTEGERNQWRTKLKSELLKVGIKNYEFKNGKTVLELRSILLPVFKVYGRENYTEIIFYDSPVPTVDLYAEHLLIITSAAKKLFSNELLKAAVAHELAHEVFSQELFNAIQSKNEEIQQAVELKCDFVGALALIMLNEDPTNISKAIFKIERAEAEAAKEYGLKQNTGTHMNATTRNKYLKKFLVEIQKFDK